MLHLRLVAFDAMLTLLATLPLIMGVAMSVLTSIQGLEHALASSDVRVRSLALVEVLHGAELGAAVTGFGVSLVLLILVRTLMAGGLSSCVTSHKCASIHEVVSAGVRHFGVNLAITCMWMFTAAIVFSATAAIILPVWYLTTGRMHSLLAGAVVGFVGALAFMSWAALRAVVDLARVVRRVHPTAGVSLVLRTAARWFARVPSTAGSLSAVWLALAVLIELLALAIELATGAGQWPGVILLALLVALLPCARSAVTVARYASMGEIGELLWDFEQDEENERWLAAVPQAIWMAPRSADIAQLDDDWPDWFPLPGSRDVDH